MNEGHLRLISVLGFFAMIAIAWLFSSDRRRVPWVTIAWGIGLQVALALLLLKSEPGRLFFIGVNGVVNRFLGYTNEGVRFVFGEGLMASGFSIVISVLPIVIFMGSLMAVLYHRSEGSPGAARPRLRDLVPLFVFGFLALAVLRTVGDLGERPFGGLVAAERWSATIAGLTGTALPEGVEGQDLSPLWRGQTTAVREVIYTAYEDLQRSVSDGQFKLIRYPPLDHVQLFDLERDPFELQNLADDPEYAEQKARLTARLEAEHAALGDPHPLVTEEKASMDFDHEAAERERQPDRHQPPWVVEKYFR